MSTIYSKFFEIFLIIFYENKKDAIFSHHPKNHFKKHYNSHLYRNVKALSKLNLQVIVGTNFSTIAEKKRVAQTCNVK